MEIASGTGTPLGVVDIELYDDQAPKTVANFLHYAGRGSYKNSIIHRSIPGFMIQGGGHTYYPNFFTGQPVYSKIPTDSPIPNEFSPSRSNIQGTIAMAKLPGDQNSATSEWFINLADNSGSPDTDPPGFDYQNGGFTVFGQVISGIEVVKEIASLPTFDGANNYPFYLPCNPYLFFGCTNPEYFLDLPTINYDTTSYIDGDPTTYLQVNNLVFVHRIPNVATLKPPSGSLAVLTTDVGMAFDFTGTLKDATAVELIKSFTSPPNQSIYFNNGIHTLVVSGPMAASGPTVIMHDGATTRPTYYYAYGPTADNPALHWYDFSYDGETGAEIKGDRIILHFVDNKRGDDDFETTDSITHTGAQAVVTSTTTGSSPTSGGCSIAAASRGALRAGDWMLVFLFLAVLALRRRRVLYLALTPALSRREREQYM